MAASFETVTAEELIPVIVSKWMGLRIEPLSVGGKLAAKALSLDVPDLGSNPRCE